MKIPGPQFNSYFSLNCPVIKRPLLICTRTHILVKIKVQKIGHAIAHAVSHQLPTLAAQLRGQVRLCGICGQQRGTGGRVSSRTSVSPATHSTESSTLAIIYHLGLYNRPNSGQYTKWTQPPTPPQTRKSVKYCTLHM
jgi:hypothetical protein